MAQARPQPGCDPRRAAALAAALSARLAGGELPAVIARNLQQELDPCAAAEFLDWLDHDQASDRQLCRLVRCLVLSTSAITTEPNTTHYEWAGRTLQPLLGAPQPVSEVWPFFSGSQRSAAITGTSGDALGPITLHELVSHVPQVLGPRGADPEQRGQKYFFVKFLDPSDFPRFAYVGLVPERLEALRGALEQRLGASFTYQKAFEQAFRQHFAELLWQDRQALETLADLIRPQLASRKAFERFKAAYKRWAIAQAEADWAAPEPLELAPFLERGRQTAAQTALAHARAIRREIVGLMHRIEYTVDQAILIETPTLHAIAGLSLQLHPKTSGNFYPKDELWIYEQVAAPRGRAGWVLVEPQRTFDKTESGADFFTPYAWEGDEAHGTLGFRKAITPSYLREFVALMDPRPHPRAHYLRQAEPMSVPGGTCRGQAEWVRLVDEPAWPYFIVRSLRFSGQGEATTPLEHHSFIELHVTTGRVEFTLSRRASGEALRGSISPAHPVLLPASLPYDTIAYRASAPARLHFFTRPSGA